MLQDLKLEEAHKRGLEEGRGEYIQRLHDAEVWNKQGNNIEGQGFI